MVADMDRMKHNVPINHNHSRYEGQGSMDPGSDDGSERVRSASDTSTRPPEADATAVDRHLDGDRGGEAKSKVRLADSLQHPCDSPSNQ